METNTVLQGDSAVVLKQLPSQSVDVVYADPPFGTQSDQVQAERSTSKLLEYSDRWPTQGAYLGWLRSILLECKRVLKATGAIFVHCDWRMSHRIRILLDEVFGEDNFRNEIIWAYKRWTNNTGTLQRLHQTIFYYTASPAHQMNLIFDEYSFTTNLDQIWQARARDASGKSVYATDERGNHVAYGKAKKGVPLGDVWDIPYLNPKAKERVGYPTQKPVELLLRLLDVASREGDIVVDPFCGSGTTLVAAQMRARKYIGIDRSEDAIRIAKQRLSSSTISPSVVAQKGRMSFLAKVDNPLVRLVLQNLKAAPVYRNHHLDGFLTETFDDSPVGLRIILDTKATSRDLSAFMGVLYKKRCAAGILVCSEDVPLDHLLFGYDLPLLIAPLQRVLAAPASVLADLATLLASSTRLPKTL
jgi:site-specific DNA-methyltransferase (adenine-specific)